MNKILTITILELMENNAIPKGKMYEAIEASIYEAAMKYTKGNQAQAAKVLGVARTTLITKLQYHFGTTLVGGVYHKPIEQFSCERKH